MYIVPSPIFEIVYRKISDAEKIKELEKLKQQLKEQGQTIDWNALNDKDPTRPNILHVACSESGVELIKWLLEQRPNFLDEVSATFEFHPIHYATACKNYKVIDFFLEQKTDVNLASKHKSQVTPILIAAQNN